MTNTRRLLGTSLLALLLVVVGLFMVCSGRVQDIAFEDEFMDDDEFAMDEDQSAYKDDLLGRLEVLEDEDGNSGAIAGTETAANAGDNGAGAGAASEAESFLTSELFDGMKQEVDELSAIAASKTRTLDSLRNELQETNTERAVLANAVEARRATAKPGLRGGGDAAVLNTEFGMHYQDALDDFYVRNYQRAIRKFRELVARGEKSELVDNCQYWIGEAYFAMGNYYQAIAEFQKVLPLENANKANDAQLMIGIAFMKAGEPDLARAELNTVITFAGNSESAKKAMRYLKKLDNA